MIHYLFVHPSLNKVLDFGHDCELALAWTFIDGGTLVTYNELIEEWGYIHCSHLHFA